MVNRGGEKTTSLLISSRLIFPLALKCLLTEVGRGRTSTTGISERCRKCLCIPNQSLGTVAACGQSQTGPFGPIQIQHLLWDSGSEVNEHPLRTSMAHGKCLLQKPNLSWIITPTPTPNSTREDRCQSVCD